LVPAFNNGQESIKSQSGKSKKKKKRWVRTSRNIKLVEKSINENHRKTVQEVCSETGLSHGTVQRIIHEMILFCTLLVLDDSHKSQVCAGFQAGLFQGRKKGFPG
jgi:hypothetical protein